ncbi:hypothetical protein Hypma_007105 [Hypsizygus marmoreus]|uniref:Uncharacterized protein n=1 Tax=Hypsizygus marmoreus TaxID=39966 RepID=A0A369KAH2_HYPMA|nr:hypothetical protein Hypma_007105 [Hypsizygus marmoreus]
MCWCQMFHGTNGLLEPRWRSTFGQFSFQANPSRQRITRTLQNFVQFSYSDHRILFLTISYPREPNYCSGYALVTHLQRLRIQVMI